MSATLHAPCFTRAASKPWFMGIVIALLTGLVSGGLAAGQTTSGSDSVKAPAVVSDKQKPEVPSAAVRNNEAASKAVDGELPKAQTEDISEAIQNVPEDRPVQRKREIKVDPSLLKEIGAKPRQ